MEDGCFAFSPTEQDSFIITVARVQKGCEKRLKGKAKKKGIVLGMTMAAAVLLSAGVYGIWEQVPSTIRIWEGAKQELQLPLPMTAEICPEEETAVQAANMGVSFPKRQEEANRSPDTLLKLDGDLRDGYRMELKLFGLIPFKTMEVQVVPERTLMPAGIPIGIYVKTEGVLVIDTGEFKGEDGQSKKPAARVLKEGDYILAVDGAAVENKRDFMETVSDCEGRQLVLKIRRDTEVYEVRVKPEKDEKGAYKLGIWIRDNAQGVGTLTYLDENGGFGALGHGINDMDTATLMELERGSLYRTDIISITKGENGTPGELTGVIDYQEENRMGSIERNTVQGIFGQFEDESVRQALTQEALPVALKQEIRLGDAQILCSVGKQEGTVCYDVEITAIHLEHDNVNRGLEILVKDERLMEKTGGIVQGMSGSPILQDGKIIGAVTHVLVQDPTRGYGIFIENMLEH